MKKSLVYTRTGDAGMTSLVGGARVAKDSVRIEAYGTLDELNSHIGVVMACEGIVSEVEELLFFVQNRLFDIGSYLASDPNDESFKMPVGVTDEDIIRIEKAIDSLDSRFPKLNSFVLPSGSMASAHTHVARTVCRRAERRIITLSGQAPVDRNVIRFINRLSDYLFVLARFNNINQNIPEIFWNKDC